MTISLGQFRGRATCPHRSDSSKRRWHGNRSAAVITTVRPPRCDRQEDRLGDRGDLDERLMGSGKDDLEMMDWDRQTARNPAVVSVSVSR
jgi:hypothetical protein